MTTPTKTAFVNNRANGINNYVEDGDNDKNYNNW